MTYFLIGDSITLTLFVTLIFALAYYIYNLLTNNVFRRIGIPGPTPIPFLDEIFNVIRKGLYKNDMDLVKKYGKIVGIYEGTSSIILLSDPDLLRNVLIKDSYAFINRRSAEGLVGPLEHGLLSLKDDHWKNARAIVSPTFSTAKLKAMYSLMDQTSNMFNNRLLEYADKQEIFNIKEISQHFALDTIGSCLFGIETNSLQNENATLVKHLKGIFTLSLANLIIIVYFLSPRLARYLYTKGYSILPKNTMDYLTELLNQILNRRRQHLERRNDFIQIMVDHEEQVKHDEQQTGTLTKTLNDKEILGQALVFLLAGYETTSTLMSFFFYVMVTEPEIQEKVYQEIQQEIGDNEIKPDNINQLHYLDMVVNETLRMYPPVIRFDRVASNDYKLGDYQILKGFIISVPVYPIHHDPIVWPDPEKFIPERFSSTEKAKRHPMAYLPFGDGPRNCIGMRFALLEAKIAIVKALRVVEIQCCEKTEIPIKLNKLKVLVPKQGIWLRAVRRSQ
ncbi:unnamed protein product [Adineta steineri]|uniref:Cytochrome P450 n=2 Tax=Adineta steineri TaxID=433720 RepID=A0A814NN76_9BILA|nr:unnamed protein product [Adineta steineri]CAF3505733.1 unnamed protein product [Adineta steineri]